MNGKFYLKYPSDAINKGESFNCTESNSSCDLHNNPFKKPFHFKFIFALLLFYITLSTTYGQIDDKSFINLTTEAGLSHGDITCFCQDYEGYIWIGTRDGVNRYDGINFTVYKNDKKDSTSISSSQVDVIFEDSKKNLWFGVGDGICRYDRDKNNFEKINFLDDNNENLDIHGIVSIFEDNTQRLWLGSNNNGVYWLDYENKRLHNFKNKDIPCIYATSINQDRKGNLWFSFRNDQYIAGGMVKYNPLTNNTKWYNSKDSLFKIDDVYSFTIDSNENLWIGSSSGLYMMNDEENKFAKLQIDKKDLNSNNNNQIHFITKDKEGNILIATDGSGLIILDPETQTFHTILSTNSKTSLLSNTIYSILPGEDGIIWIGCWGAGISIYDKRFRKFDLYRQEENTLNSITGKSVTSFTEDKNGNMWISTDGGGINYFNPKDKRFINNRSKIEDSNSLTNNKVLALTTDNEGGLWAGMWNGGLNYFLIEDDRLILKKKYNKVDPNLQTYTSVFKLYSDKENNLWVGTYQLGAYKHSKGTEKFTSVSKLLKPEENVNTSYNINDFKEDGDFVWIASEYNGLMRLNSRSGEYKIFKHDDSDSASLPNNSVHAIHIDSKNRLWVGSDKGGLSLYDRKSEKFINYSVDDGLPDNSIVGILEDKAGNLWLSSNNGISKVFIDSTISDPVKKFRNYSTKDGLQGSVFNRWSYYKSSTGEMYFGGLNGFNVFHPDSIKDNDFIPPVYITDFLLFNKPVEIGAKDSPLEKHVSQTDKIVLRYKQNYFTLKFIALNFIYSENNQYAYYMQGFEKDWNYSHNKTEATYTNLAPGKYTFRVKASNNDGVWNEGGASLKITILPPWWKELWFKISVALIITGFVVSYYYLRLNSIRKLNVRLKELVTERTREIEFKNEKLIKQSNELKLTNALLEERQKQIEDQAEELIAQKEELIRTNTELNDLNATKDKFFSIIAHDIKNPFSVILGFSEILHQDFNDFSDHQKQETVEIIYNSSRSLFELLENLLQWSKSQRGLIDFKPAKTSIKNTLKHILSVLKYSAESKDIKIKSNIPENDLFLFVDSQSLSTILRNLIGNAIKFTYAGGKIEIEAKEADGAVLISVQDNGVGMSKEMINDLFRININHTSAGTNEEKGSGLGLILVKEFIEHQGGKIWVESAEGKGSKFTFSLPMYDINNQ